MNTKDFVIGSQIQVPQVVTNWAESRKEKAGVFATKFANQHVYLVATGQCPSGGYRVMSRTSTQEPLTVEYRIQGPDPEAFVIQIITYPYELFFSAKPLHFIRLENNTRHPVEPKHEAPITLFE